MGRLLWLPTVLRAAGLTVRECDGWQTRHTSDSSLDGFGPLRGVIAHETRAASPTSTDVGELGVLINGRVGLSGPIAQCFLNREGVWYVVAAGTCHHVKTGWAGPFAGLGNDSLLGVEPAHSLAEDWADKPAQYRSYVRGVAAIVRHANLPPPVGHKEHQPGDKSDPEFSMATFRADVAREITEWEDDDMFSEQDRTDLGYMAWRVEALAYALDTFQGGPEKGKPVPLMRRVKGLESAVAALQTVVEQLAAALAAGGGSVDTAAVLAGVDERLTALREQFEAETRDAVADLGEGGAAQVRADAA
jgi:hypothetical protein